MEVSWPLLLNCSSYYIRYTSLIPLISSRNILQWRHSIYRRRLDLRSHLAAELTFHILSTLTCGTAHFNWKSDQRWRRWSTEHVSCTNEMNLWYGFCITVQYKCMLAISFWLYIYTIIGYWLYIYITCQWGTRLQTCNQSNARDNFIELQRYSLPYPGRSLRLIQNKMMTIYTFLHRTCTS